MPKATSRPGDSGGFSQMCSTCEFWMDLNNKGEGHCRRFPPQFRLALLLEPSAVDRHALLSEHPQASSYEFPVTHIDDWCGEHKPLPEFANITKHA